FRQVFPASLFFPCCSVSEAVFCVFFRGIPFGLCFPWLLQVKPPQKTPKHRFTRGYSKQDHRKRRPELILPNTFFPEPSPKKHPATQQKYFARFFSGKKLTQLSSKNTKKKKTTG
ncbi:MAG: hypothetical protein O0X49_04015, partial [Methanocorpusculum sp.]|nr:hypothetical protein [Methanocorpusculum sp.]